MHGHESPAVAVVMPLRNEATTLEQSVDAVLDQEYDGPLDIVLAVAPSDDSTDRVAGHIAASDPRVRVVDNPDGGAAAGLNAAIAASTAEIVARVDGHSQLPRGYVRQAVRALERTGADVVGGIQDAQGSTPFERAVAAAMSSRFGVGDAKFHYGGTPGPTDTAYLGVFRRSALDRTGGYDETLLRNQDYELNWRIRDTGGIVWFEPSLAVAYRPRGTLRSLARQYFEYGQWKRETLRRHPRSLRARHLAAPLVVATNAVSLVLAATIDRRFAVVPATYCVAACLASAIARPRESGSTARLPVVFATMHHAWGVGFLVGTRRPTR